MGLTGEEPRESEARWCPGWMLTGRPCLQVRIGLLRLVSGSPQGSAGLEVRSKVLQALTAADGLRDSSFSSSAISRAGHSAPRDRVEGSHQHAAKVRVVPGQSSSPLGSEIRLDLIENSPFFVEKALQAGQLIEHNAQEKRSLLAVISSPSTARGPCSPRCRGWRASPSA